MAEIYFISDTHFEHENFLKFKDSDGNIIRPFEDVEEMNELIINNWNAVVSRQDKIYHLGDVSFKYQHHLSKIMSRLNGKKRLILGNHDRIKGTNLQNYFQKIMAWRIFKDQDFVASHFPLYLGDFKKGKKEVRSYNFNVHGHIHHNTIEDLRYLNICVEKTGYTPISLETIDREIKRRKEILKA